MIHAMTRSICLLFALALPSSVFGADAPSAAIEQDPANEHIIAGDAQMDSTSYVAWLLSLRAAVDATREDPMQAPTLALELHKVATFTESLGADAEGRHLRDRALLDLCQAYLDTHKSRQAALTMDEAIRSAGGSLDGLDVQHYGSSLAALHQERLAAITEPEGAAIRVNCRVPCRVFLNERPAAADSRHLPDGAYRVHIVATDGALPPLDLSLLTLTGKTKQITFPAPAPAGSVPASAKTPAEAKSRTMSGTANEVALARQRNLPRWLEIAAILGGAAAVGAGAFLTLSEGHCIGDRTTVPTLENPGQCSSIYAARFPGLSLIAAGSTLVAGGVITLSLDESQLRRDRQTPQSRNRKLILGYRRSF